MPKAPLDLRCAGASVSLNQQTVANLEVRDLLPTCTTRTTGSANVTASWLDDGRMS